MFCRLLFFLLLFFVWPLYYLYFFGLRIMITPLVSSRVSLPFKGSKKRSNPTRYWALSIQSYWYYGTVASRLLRVGGYFPGYFLHTRESLTSSHRPAELEDAPSRGVLPTMETLYLIYSYFRSVWTWLFTLSLILLKPRPINPYSLRINKQRIKNIGEERHS
jgi:hypothetical protein